MSLSSRLKSPEFSKSLFLMALRGCTLAIKLLLTLYIARFLGLHDLGVYGLIAAAQILLPSAASLGINHSLSRHVVTQGDDEIATQTRGYLLVVLMFYAVGIAMAYTYLGGRIDAQIFWVTSGLLLLENINSDAYHLLANQSKPVFANALHFVRSALWAVGYMAAGLLDDAFRTFDWLLVFWLVGSSTAFVLLLHKLRHLPVFSSQRSTESRISRLRHQISESWFLYTNGIVTSLGTQADRYIVTAMLGLELAGVYVFYLQVSSALSNLHYTGLIQLQRPKVVLASRTGHASTQEKVNAVILAAVITTILSSTAAYFVVSAIIPMLDKPLLTQWHMLLYFALGGVISNVVVEAQRLYFYALHEDRPAFYINLVSSVIGIVMLYALLTQYSLTGAGIALLMTGIIRMTLQYGATSAIQKHRSTALQ